MFSGAARHTTTRAPSKTAPWALNAECICACSSLQFRMWHHESVSRRSRPLDSIACAPAATTSTSNRTVHPPQPPPAAKRTPGWVGWRPPDKTTTCNFCLRRFILYYYLRICTNGPTQWNAARGFQSSECTVRAFSPLAKLRPPGAERSCWLSFRSSRSKKFPRAQWKFLIGDVGSPELCKLQHLLPIFNATLSLSREAPECEKGYSLWVFSAAENNLRSLRCFLTILKIWDTFLSVLEKRYIFITQSLRNWP
jgi:hypothetical protein